MKEIPLFQKEKWKSMEYRSPSILKNLKYNKISLDAYDFVMLFSHKTFNVDVPNMLTKCPDFEERNQCTDYLICKFCRIPPILLGQKLCKWVWGKTVVNEFTHFMTKLTNLQYLLKLISWCLGFYCCVPKVLSLSWFSSNSGIESVMM